MAGVQREFFERRVDEVAPDLLGMLLSCGDCLGRIVEVEAYRSDDDPASHGFGGKTRRNAAMFGPPARLYVYFTYGMHWCANVVCEPEGSCAAVLIRAVAPLRGLDEMWRRRPAARRQSDLCSGPAKLTAALGVDGRHNGCDLLDQASEVRLSSDGMLPGPIGNSPRIGVTKGAERLWRWYLLGDPNNSRPSAR